MNAMKKAAAAIFSAALCGLWMPTVCFANVTDKDGNTIETVTSGDFEYSVMVDSEESGGKAACVEKYTGTDTDVVIPDTMDGMPVVAIGDTAFAGNYTIKNVTLPKDLMGIGTHAFAECTAMENFYVADGSEIFSSRDGVLYAHGGTWLVRYPITKIPAVLEIPEGVVLIGDNAVSYSRVLRKVTFPKTLTTIAIAAFADDVSLEEIEFPPTVTEIPNFCCYHCAMLKSVKMHNDITSIGDGAFAMTMLETVEIPVKCKSIGQAAFASTKMSEVTIPSSVEDIGYCAFGYQTDSTNELYADDTFVIYGEKGSAASSYANDIENGNHFEFVAKGEPSTSPENNEPDEDTTETVPANDDGDDLDIGAAPAETEAEMTTTAQTTTTKTAVKLPTKTKGMLAGVIGGGAAVLIGIVAAIVAVLKKSKKPSDGNTDES